MTDRHVHRQLLQRVGLLELARETRGLISSVPWLRDNWRFWLRGALDDLPIPPLRLVRSSTGTSSLRWLFDGGVLAANSIKDLLIRNKVEIGTLGSILDFGCGCGRVTRQWARLPAAIHGCDYNREPIRWCQRNLTFGTFIANDLNPPLPFGSSQFDLVYALSVFTHLPETMSSAWLGEIRRVMKRGGWLILSTHGEAYLGDLSAEQQREFQADHAVVKHAESAGTNLCGVYFSERYLRQRFANGFNVVDFVPQGAKGNPIQDLVLLQKT